MVTIARVSPGIGDRCLGMIRISNSLQISKTTSRDNGELPSQMAFLVAVTHLAATRLFHHKPDLVRSPASSFGNGRRKRDDQALSGLLPYDVPRCGYEEILRVIRQHRARKIRQLRHESGKHPLSGADGRPGWRYGAHRGKHPSREVGESSWKTARKAFTAVEWSAADRTPRDLGR